DAGGVLQHVRYRPTDGEVAAEPPSIRESENEEVGLPLGRLVDDGGGDVAGLEEDGLDLDPGRLGGRLGGVEDPLRLLGLARDVGVEGERPVDLDDVDGDELGL